MYRVRLQCEFIYLQKVKAITTDAAKWHSFANY